MNVEQCCGNCSWHIPETQDTYKRSQWICSNKESEGYGLPTDFEDTCEEFHDREN